MSLDNSPYCFRFEGRLWVSEVDPAEALRQFQAQRAWDTAAVRRQRWWPAVTIGAVLGIVGIIALSTWGNLPIALYLFTLPVGVIIGSVLGAVVNKRILGVDGVVDSERPELVEVTRVPFLVSRKAPEDASRADIIQWSKQGFVPKESEKGR